jgi:hypothetical protein
VENEIAVIPVGGPFSRGIGIARCANYAPLSTGASSAPVLSTSTYSAFAREINASPYTGSRFCAQQLLTISVDRKRDH